MPAAHLRVFYPGSTPDSLTRRGVFGLGLVRGSIPARERDQYSWFGANGADGGIGPAAGEGPEVVTPGISMPNFQIINAKKGKNMQMTGEFVAANSYA